MHCLSRSALNTYLILWGIIGILEYHVDRNAGHEYFRDGSTENAGVMSGNPACEIRPNAIKDW
jgi:hypothetical protein